MKKRIIIFAAAAFVAAAAVLYLFSTKDGEGAGIPCMLHLFTGLYCPGCGASRAIRALLHLEFYQALRYNAVLTVSAPLLGAYFIALAVSYLRFGKDKVSEKIPQAPLYVLIAIFLLYGILRNIPAFSFLAPTAV